jgi:replicative DNA helicase
MLDLHSVDVKAVAYCLDREQCLSIMGILGKGAVSKKAETVIRVLHAYHQDFAGTPSPSLEGILTWFRLYSPHATEGDVGSLSLILEMAFKEKPTSSLVTRLQELVVFNQISDIKSRAEAGEDLSVIEEVLKLVETRQATTKLEAASTDIASSLEASVQSPGLSFRLACLNAGVRPLRGGDFVVIAAGVDCGKTSFCSSEVTHMLPQLEHLFPGENRTVLWMNNEGAEDIIIQRTFQSALGKTTEQLLELSKTGYLTESYTKAVGGRLDVLQVFACQGRSTTDLEAVFKRARPAVVVFDMLDNVLYSGKITPSGDARTDQVKEALYQWARGMAVKYDFVAIATSQLSHEGCNQEYPGMDFLKDSRIAKQGAADLIIIIGTKKDPGFESIRYISTPKNKRKITGVPKYVRAAAAFDEDTGRFYDMQAK